eukprot:2814283-Pleurochrysis_carterae.AAC.1
MTVPEGCKENPRFHGPHGEEMVCKLNKGIYGLKQNGHGWYLKLRDWYLPHGFTQCGSDPSIFVRHVNSSMVCVGIYVDDLAITGTDQAIADENCDSLDNKHFEIENKGEADYLLGINIEQSDGKIKLHQSRYIDTLVNEHLGENEHPAAYCSIPYHKQANGNMRSGQKRPHRRRIPTLFRKYQSLVGSLLFVATVTRPDIAYSTGMLAQCMSYLTQLLAQARQVLRYRKGTRTYNLTFTNKASGKTFLDGYMPLLNNTNLR